MTLSFPPNMPESTEKLFIFDTHPIQYRAPVFAKLSAKLPGLKVYFFNEAFDGDKWWFHEVNKVPEQKWEMVLKAGYPNEVLGTQKTGVLAFGKQINHTVGTKLAVSLLAAFETSWSMENLPKTLAQLNDKHGYTSREQLIKILDEVWK